MISSDVLLGAWVCSALLWFLLKSMRQPTEEWPREMLKYFFQGVILPVYIVYICIRSFLRHGNKRRNRKESRHG
jgi:hypothetical protein